MAQAYALYHGNISADNQLTYQNLALVRGSMARTGVVRGSGTGGTPSLAGYVAVNGIGLVLNVNTVDWFYTGYFAQSTGGQAVVTLAANPSGSIRIDRIVLQIDTSSSAASITVVQGTPGSGAPAINTLGTRLQLSLAQVSVSIGATSATNLVQANVTDERTVQAVCGYATPVLHAAEHLAGGFDPLPSMTPYTGGVQGATANVIDVTQTNQFWAVNSGTGATNAVTASAVSTTGALLKLTYAATTGTVTMTFGGTFRPSATLAVTIGHFASVIFESNGTNWRETWRSAIIAS